ncbi:twin-arginine translocase TatA/TatE family subunit [Paenibacillus popilliae]|uniref:Sec-independent protein translocase protein TatA n=1 Tax=Paenibacillus popilliae ATCC 14706 TaxID=1212764 RepID=M9LCG7_PAEPP|nr:twin-arginine translocase TatA/TatE family subunit [Paenibacillus popilliae]GAC43787.1 Sec-independent protein secretion pathway component [Paenibacillus popilliae ATCC 14706]
MFNGIGISGILLLLVITVLLFGPNKLPELGRAFGRTLREFKEGARDIMGDEPSAKPARPDIQTVDVESAGQEPAKASGEANSALQRRRLPE